MSRLYVPFLLAGMILTGSSNSLWSKWQDMQCVENCTDPDPATHVVYEQPVWQTLQMFIGEMLCFLPVIYTALVAPRPPVQLDTDDASKSQPLRGARILLLWIPAACDLTGTTLMNVGLLYTPVSIYQMTRGSVVLFVGTFSVLFLRRRLWLYQWVSLIIVMSGVALVGYSGSLAKHAISQQAIGALARISGTEEPEVTKVLVGVFLTIFAQVFTATQFVVEEKIMSRYSVSPLVAVGFEGLFGTLSVLLFVPFLAIPAVTRISPFFDLPRGWTQMINTPPVLFSGIAICLSISLFNFFGLSVTRHVSATARSLADTCRTLSIWLISLGLGWEHFVWPISLVQVLGFALLVYGTFLFNDLVAPLPCLPGPPTAAEVDEGEEGERTGLLSGSIEAGAHSQTLDETAVLPADLGRGGYDVLPQGEHIRGYEVADEQGSSAGVKP